MQGNKRLQEDLAASSSSPETSAAERFAMQTESEGLQGFSLLLAESRVELEKLHGRFGAVLCELGTKEASRSVGSSTAAASARLQEFYAQEALEQEELEKLRAEGCMIEEENVPVTGPQIAEDPEDPLAEFL